jgi:chorismate dehydratase
MSIRLLSQVVPETELFTRYYILTTGRRFNSSSIRCTLKCIFFASSKLDELEKTIKVGAVSYLNTKPLMYAFKHGLKIEGMQIVEEYPAKVAAMLLNDEIDVGLVPVAIIPKLKEHHIIGDYCIGAEQEVASVCLFSEVPLQEITKVLLDYQSKTSVALARVLIERYWKLPVVFEEADINFRDEIKGTTAAVVIGDRAFSQRKISTYRYDLAEAWINFTGLPFVFAAWVANKRLPEDFITRFNAANKTGLQNLDAVVAENVSPDYDLKKYYSENISYELTDGKRKGLAKFLSFLASPKENASRKQKAV